MQSQTPAIPYQNKESFYKELHSEIHGMAEKEWFVNLANASALLKQHLPQINWVGFYLNHKSELLLSSFQGLPACTRIAFGKGVCGTAAQSKSTQLVDDVDQFPGHIVCDSASRSEIVVPMLLGDRLLGVLDVDAPILARFTDEDRKGLEKFVQILIESTDWPASF